MPAYLVFVVLPPVQYLVQCSHALEYTPSKELLLPAVINAKHQFETSTYTEVLIKKPFKCTTKLSD